MSNNILFIFEGETAEKQIANSLNVHFFPENSFIHCTYCNNIYNLMRKLSMDEDLDTFSLLKDVPKNKKKLEPFSRNDFAEIYMFFDYDGHDTSADDSILKAALNFFDEETSFGKLFINYPMIESLKHCTNLDDFKRLKVLAKENIKYKQLVSSTSDNCFININKYSKQIWTTLIEFHLKKMNYVMSSEFSIPSEKISQSDLFLKQIEKYIEIDQTVAVLSSFPIFIFDYFGCRYILDLFKDN